MEHAVSTKHMVHRSSWSGTAGGAETEERYTLQFLSPSRFPLGVYL